MSNKLHDDLVAAFEAAEKELEMMDRKVAQTEAYCEALKVEARAQAEQIIESAKRERARLLNGSAELIKSFEGFAEL